jgi:hypothetical protein
MIHKKMLGVLAIGTLVGLSVQPSGAKTVTPDNEERVLVSSERAAAEVAPPRVRTAHRQCVTGAAGIRFTAADTSIATVGAVACRLKTRSTASAHPRHLACVSSS